MEQSDKDIKQWDERLKDQASRDWENYVHRRIDLTEARVDQPVLIAGEFIYVEAASDEDVAVAKIKLNRNTNDPLDLELGVEIKTVFTEVFITNDALADEWIDIIFGINFEYKKKIADGFTNPITTQPGVDLVLLPGAGGITVIGDAGAQSHGLVNNDDLFVSGKLEVDGLSYFDGVANFYANALFQSGIYKSGGAASYLMIQARTETLVIPVGQGAAGVATVQNLVEASSTVAGCCCRVLEAPGGGATTIDIGRTNGGNLDEFIDGIGTALGTTGTFAANHDAATTTPFLNAMDDTLTLTTDANVTGNQMRVRIVTYYLKEIPPTV